MNFTLKIVNEMVFLLNKTRFLEMRGRYRDSDIALHYQGERGAKLW